MGESLITQFGIKFGYIVSVDSHGLSSNSMKMSTGCSSFLIQEAVFLSAPPSIDKGVKTYESLDVLHCFQANKLTATVSLVLLEETRVLYQRQMILLLQ